MTLRQIDTSDTSILSETARSDGAIFSSEEYSQSASSGWITLWALGAFTDEMHVAPPSRIDAFTFESSAYTQPISGNSAKLFVTWRDRAADFLHNWSNASAKDFTDFTGRYLIIFLGERDVRLLIASVSNIIKFNHPIEPEQAAAIACSLQRIKYSDLDKNSVLSFIREMRSHRLNLS